MTTAPPEVDTAVEALKEGAIDYLRKPMNLDELRQRVRRMLDRRALHREVRALRRRLGERLPQRVLIGSSPEMLEVQDLVTRVAPHTSAVLIEGESGTGKEIVAAAIHRLSPRAANPFIPVNCGAIPTELLESELFGHVRGAFTGAVDPRKAGRSSLTRSASCRCRSRRSSCACCRSGKSGRWAPLRERHGDIPALVTHFLMQFNERYGRTVRGITPEGMTLLMAHAFPGNVRELENVIERAYALGASSEISAADLAILDRRPTPAAPATTNGPLPTLAEVERDLIARALDRYPGNKEDAARAIGLSPRTMYRRLKEYGLHT